MNKQLSRDQISIAMTEIALKAQAIEEMSVSVQVDPGNLNQVDYLNSAIQSLAQNIAIIADLVSERVGLKIFTEPVERRIMPPGFFSEDNSETVSAEATPTAEKADGWVAPPHLGQANGAH